MTFSEGHSNAMNRRADGVRHAPGVSALGAGGRMRICVVVGTRPEAIKLAPVILELEKNRETIESIVVTTAKHREMLAQALEAFSITPHVDLGLITAPQATADFTSRALIAMNSCLSEIRPDLVVLQGDNGTVPSAALAAHYLGIPVAHVEAGVRSGNMRNPFPEELNRRLASIIADFHFAPTERCRHNLLNEGVSSDRILVTGNTVVDALRLQPRRGYFNDPHLNALPWEKRRVVLVTLHRREHIGSAMVNACRAIAELVTVHPDLHIVLPVHLDPRVRDIAHEELSDIARVDLLEPLSYSDMVEVLRRSEFAMTDSSGVQEECAALARAVLILRKTTDRPEVVEAGFGQIVGTETLPIVEAASRLLGDADTLAQMTEGECPFGDGLAAARIVGAILRRAPRFAGGPPIIEGPALLPPLRAIER